jgi:hypothetical protein
MRKVACEDLSHNKYILGFFFKVQSFSRMFMKEAASISTSMMTYTRDIHITKGSRQGGFKICRKIRYRGWECFVQFRCPTHMRGVVEQQEQSFYLGENGLVKKNSAVYQQMQIYAHVFNYPGGFFVEWTPEFLRIQFVKRDDSFCGDMA